MERGGNTANLREVLDSCPALFGWRRSFELTFDCKQRFLKLVMKSGDFQKQVEESIRNPKNMGELADADAVGTVGSPGCGDMLRLWLKYRVENGRKLIDKATFQSFGCETAIAAASLATELIRGKTPQEAAALSGPELAADLGPLPPTKIHCAQMVEEALRSALSAESTPAAAQCSEPTTSPASLIDRLNSGASGKPGAKLVFLEEEKLPPSTHPQN